jgi:hypothetical protein
MTFPLYFGETLIFHSPEIVSWNREQAVSMSHVKPKMNSYSGVAKKIQLAIPLEQFFDIVKAEWGLLIFRNPTLGTLCIDFNKSTLELMEVNGVWKLEELCFSQR